CSPIVHARPLPWVARRTVPELGTCGAFALSASGQPPLHLGPERLARLTLDGGGWLGSGGRRLDRRRRRCRLDRRRSRVPCLVIRGVRMLRLKSAGSTTTAIASSAPPAAASLAPPPLPPPLPPPSPPPPPPSCSPASHPHRA